MDWTCGELRNDVLEFLVQYNKKKGSGIEIENLLTTLLYVAKEIWQSDPENHRWWDVIVKVVKLDGKFICYEDATSNAPGISAIRSGCKLDLSRIHFVKPVKKEIIVYV